MKKPDSKRHVFTILSLLAMTFALIGTLYIGLGQNPKSVPMALVGKKAHSFTGSWLQGQEFAPAGSADRNFALKDFLGKPLVLNFWASWCFSCRAEASLIEAYWRRYGPQGVHFVGIAVNDTEAAAMGFARQYGKTYILGLDADDKSAINYGVTGVPETFFIDRDGMILYKEAGPLRPEILDKYIGKIRKVVAKGK